MGQQLVGETHLLHQETALKRMVCGELFLKARVACAQGSEELQG